MRLCVYSVFDKYDRPLVTGVRDTKTGITKIINLYLPKTGKSYYEIEQSERVVTAMILSAQSRGYVIVTSDWKRHIHHYKLPHCRARYDAYDLQLTGAPDFTDPKRARSIIRTMLERMGEMRIHEWQRVFADASVVYQDMEDVGFLYSGIQCNPVWSQDTRTGRSKILGKPNIQGINRKHKDHIRSPSGCEDDVLILFDWVSADIRFAGLFADDDVLELAFRESDPYTHLAVSLGLDQEVGARDECKLALLRGINSMDTDSPVFSVYPKLGVWIERCRSVLARDDGYLDTFLGRRFRMKDKENSLQVLNGCMQGSVAHAMQLTMRRIWEELGPKLLAEIHDSLVITCAPDLVEETIDTVAEIMLRPFEDLCDRGLVDSSPDFPFKVHVGPAWHDWKLSRIYRGESVEVVRE